MGPTTAGASLSGWEMAEVMLCMLSLECFGESVCVDIVVYLCIYVVVEKLEVAIGIVDGVLSVADGCGSWLL